MSRRKTLSRLGVLILCIASLHSITQAADSALTGEVSSAAESRMEGVLVTAKRSGSNMSVTVVTDSDGRYAFPTSTLPAGTYTLSIRAVGYELENSANITVAADKATELNLRLTKTRDLASQLTSAEWMLSAPGPETEKRWALSTIDACQYCHGLDRIFKSSLDAKGFLGAIARMHTYAETSVPDVKHVPQPHRSSTPMPETVDAAETEVTRPTNEEMAKYFSRVSRKDGKWNYELQTYPRPSGEATRVIFTQYDLPQPDSKMHDAAVDAEGIVWYPDFSRSYLGRLDPRTGELKEWPIPLLKPGFPEGGSDIKFDQEGNPWLALFAQGGIAKFDKKAEKFTTWRTPPPPEDNHTGLLTVSPDGTVWFKGGNRMVHRLDPKTNKISSYSYASVPSTYSFYDLRADSRGTLYFAAKEGQGAIAELNERTGEWVLYHTPTPKSGPRRGNIDSQDRFWFAEYYAGNVGMFDTRTKAFKEWSVSATPWDKAYDATTDKNGEAWVAGMEHDYIYRLNPVTGKVTRYLLPTLDTNVRRITVDNSTNPISVWVGDSHRGKITRLQPMD